MTPNALRDVVNRYQRNALGLLPSPLHPAPSFSRAVGTEVWIKRDDLTGIALGANKIRKLEFLVAEARAGGADTLITSGGLQSNHARSVAAVAAMNGWDCHLVLGGKRPAAPSGSLVLDLLLGARLHFTPSLHPPILEATAQDLARELRRQGRAPFVIPIGGSTPIGALGFVSAYVELVEQCASFGIDPGSIVHASSSGATQAGLEVGRQLLGRAAPAIIGVAVSRIGGEFQSKVAALVKETAQLLGWDRELEPPRIAGGFVGSGYAQPNEASRDAIRSLARTEGILTDPIYTGKALQAVVELGPHALGPGPVVFWHTGGLPAIFAHEQGLARWSYAAIAALKM